MNLLASASAPKLVLAVGAVLVFVWLYQGQRSKHPFNAYDLLLDPATGKASVNAISILFTLALSLWVVVHRELGGGRADDGVASLLTSVLGVFVGGRVIAQGISAYKDTKPGPTTFIESRSITVPPGADVDDAAAPAPAPATTRGKNK